MSTMQPTTARQRSAQEIGANLLDAMNLVSSVRFIRTEGLALNESAFIDARVVSAMNALERAIKVVNDIDKSEY